MYIIINAAIIALNESLVMHYWQNTTTDVNTQVQIPTGQNIYGESWNPPWGDGRGREKYGSNNNDKRREVYLWGSVVQKHRGYMLRNPSSPYNNAPIGMDKSYHYDGNLYCTPPPFYPAVEYADGSGEISVNLTGFKNVNIK